MKSAVQGAFHPGQRPQQGYQSPPSAGFVFRNHRSIAGAAPWSISTRYAGRSPAASERQQGSRDRRPEPPLRAQRVGARTAGRGGRMAPVQGATLLGEPRHKTAHLRAQRVGRVLAWGRSPGRRGTWPPWFQSRRSRRGRCRAHHFFEHSEQKMGVHRVRYGPPTEHLCGEGALKAGWPRSARAPREGREGAQRPSPAASPQRGLKAQARQGIPQG